MSEETKVLDESANSSSDSSSSDSGSTLTEAPVVEDSAPVVDPVKVAPANSGYVTSDTETIHDVSEADRETYAHDGEAKDAEVAYTFVTHLDPQRQIDPHGVYLDDIQRRDAELIRARQEDREPDLENPPAVASTPLVPTVVAQNLAPSGAAVPVNHRETINVGFPQDDSAEDEAE